MAAALPPHQPPTLTNPSDAQRPLARRAPHSHSMSRRTQSDNDESNNDQPLTLTESHMSAEASSTLSSETRPRGLRSIPSTTDSNDTLTPPDLVQTTNHESVITKGNDSNSESNFSQKKDRTPTASELEKGEFNSNDASSDRHLGGGADFNEKGSNSSSSSSSPSSPPPPKASDGTDIIVIDWKGKTDPLMPKNWSYRRRMAATLIIAAFTFLSPLSSTMIAPAANQIAVKFGIVNDVEISMITSIFVLAYAIGPLFLGPMSELYGRTIVLQSANLIYLIFNLVCGFATSKSQILAFRFLAGLGGSAPLAIGAGVLGDLWRAEERGAAAALYSIGPLLGPAVGPIAGGWIAQCLPGDGYKWVFYSTTIFCAMVQVAGILFLQETYEPVLLHRQALALKKEMSLPKDSDKVQTVYDLKNGKKTVGHIVRHGLVRPFVMLRHEKIIQMLAAYMALIYGTIYLVTVTTTSIFTGVYGFSVGIAGTNFIAQGLGFFVWSQIQARLLDIVYRKLKVRYGGEGKPEYRLPMMVPASMFLPFGLILYGWGAQHHLHWIVPDIGLFFIAAGMIGNFQTINVYLIDAFTLHAASALAAASSLRSLCGFGFPLFAPYMFQSLGYGWGCTVLALVAIAIGCPAAPILFKYGEQIRASSKYAAKKK